MSRQQAWHRFNHTITAASVKQALKQATPGTGQYKADKAAMHKVEVQSLASQHTDSAPPTRPASHPRAYDLSPRKPSYGAVTQSAACLPRAAFPPLQSGSRSAFRNTKQKDTKFEE
jgi:hypothetical protein